MCYDLKDGEDWLPYPMAPLDLESTNRHGSTGQLDHRLQRSALLEIRPTNTAGLDAHPGLAFGEYRRLAFFPLYGLRYYDDPVIRVKVDGEAFAWLIAVSSVMISKSYLGGRRRRSSPGTG